MKILVTGSAGFICGYVVEELLSCGHEVVGIDNFSKYGEVNKSYDNHPNYHFTKGDAKDVDLMKKFSSPNTIDNAENNDKDFRIFSEDKNTRSVINDE